MIFLNEQPARMSDLRPGDRLELFLDAQGRVRFLLARFKPVELEGQVEAVQADRLVLRVEEVDAGREDSPVPLPVSYAPGQTVTLSVYGPASVRVDGRVRPWSPDLLRPGDRVEVKAHADAVVAVTVKRP